jgi:hypothetical protein
MSTWVADRVVLAGRATDVGGPSEDSAYERWVGCARAFDIWMCFDGDTGEVFQRRLCPDHGGIVAWLGDLPGPVAVTYEAGPTGFGLARALRAAGILCEVAAPSKLIRPVGDRVKTDARDAAHLARLLHLGQITAVTVPLLVRKQPVMWCGPARIAARI